MKDTSKLNPDLVSTLSNLFDTQEDNIDKAVRCLKVMAHPARMKIFCVLQTGEFSVQQLEQYVGVAQATLSQHLSLLKDRGILASRRQGNFSLYRIANEEMVQLFGLIQGIFCEHEEA